MRNLLLFLLFLALSVSDAFAQSIPSEKTFRILWTPEKTCKVDAVDSDNKPVALSDEERTKLNASCDFYAKDGVEVAIVKFKDYVVATSIVVRGYVMLDVLVVNNSNERLLVNPALARFNYWKDINADASDAMTPIPPEKIASKIMNRVKWANILNGVGASLQKQTATANSSTTGNASIYDNRGNSANGTYSQKTETTVTAPDSTAQVEAIRQNNQRASNGQNLSDSIISNALKVNTLFPNESTNGVIYFPRKKAKAAVFVFTLDGVKIALVPDWSKNN